VRMALGATSSDVVRMVVCEAMARAGIGLGIGLAASLAVTRFMSTMLYGGSDRGAIILGAVVALLALVAAIASYIPARRASSIDPTAALRCE